MITVDTNNCHYIIHLSQYLPRTKMADPEEGDGQGGHVDDDDDGDGDEERRHEESIWSHPAEQGRRSGHHHL
jgi:hypothetical protein